MEANLEPPNSATTGTASEGDQFLSPPSPPLSDYDYNDDSNCSTPYVSAPSSPGRSFPAGVGFFYSAPTSPMHYVLASAPARTSLAPAVSDASSNGSFEFEFSDRIDSPAPEIGSSAMSTADELFLNGQIRPMTLSAHLKRPQALAPLIDFGGEMERENDKNEEDDDEWLRRSRELRFRSRSQRRRARSLSPLRTTPPVDWLCSDDGDSISKKDMKTEEREFGDVEAQKEATEQDTPPPAGSRSSSAGRSSRRWDFLKDFLRSKSEGRSNNKFWHNISFSPAKERKEKAANPSTPAPEKEKEKVRVKKEGKEAPAKRSPAAAKRRSAHEMHYAAKRAQAEERRKRTFLPYRQGVLGCLGFNSKSYGAFNGFTRTLNPVSSR